MILCPHCQSPDNGVKDSRPAPGNQIRRRRYCDTCKTNFTTYEVVNGSVLTDAQAATALVLVDECQRGLSLIADAIGRPT